MVIPTDGSYAAQCGLDNPTIVRQREGHIDDNHTKINVSEWSQSYGHVQTVDRQELYKQARPDSGMDISEQFDGFIRQSLSDGRMLDQSELYPPGSNAHNMFDVVNTRPEPDEWSAHCDTAPPYNQ